MSHLPSIKEMEKAVLKRDPSYDGIFFIAVRTTGIFCRPICPARKPLRQNMVFYATAQEALRAGYRACKRCRPMDTNGRTPEWVSRLLTRVDKVPSARLTDGELRRLSIDPARARRYFLDHYGMTFQAYCRGRRMAEAFKQIRGGVDVDNVALDQGYESLSGFREAFARTFGTPPRRGRLGECIVVSWVETPLGPVILGANAKGLCLTEFTDRAILDTQLDILRKRFDCAIVPGANEHLDQAREELERYFAGRLKKFEVPLVFPGTPFQEAVWNGLLRIPYGETRSYEDLACAIGTPGAQRAVGAANGMNRIGIIIPCHRVVNKSGKLGGYGGGLWRKQFLLDLERGQNSLISSAAAKDKALLVS